MALLRTYRDRGHESRTERRARLRVFAISGRQTGGPTRVVFLYLGSYEILFFCQFFSYKVKLRMWRRVVSFAVRNDQRCTFVRKGPTKSGSPKTALNARPYIFCRGGRPASFVFVGWEVLPSAALVSGDELRVFAHGSEDGVDWAGFHQFLSWSAGFVTRVWKKWRLSSSSAFCFLPSCA